MFATFAHNDAKNNFLIVLFNKDASSLMLLDILPALTKTFSFSCSDCAIDRIDVSPTNISLNFLIVSFLLMRSTFLPIFVIIFTISGEALISLMMLLRSFSSTFNSFVASLNIFIMLFIFWFPIRRSFIEMFFSLLKASAKADIAPPLFCFSMFFVMASATLSEALSLNFAMAGVPPPCFARLLVRLSIAFLIPFVSSSIF